GGGKGLGDALVLGVALEVRSGGEVLERAPEGFLRVRQRDAVLGAPRPREARFDGLEVELELGGERRPLRGLVVPQALLLGVRLDERDLRGRAARELEV